MKNLTFFRVIISGMFFGTILSTSFSCRRDADSGATAQLAGGQVAIRQQDYPSTLYLQTIENTICTGTKIGAGTILTAAHCLFDHSGNPIGRTDLYVSAVKLAGTNNNEKPFSAKAREGWARVKNVNIHPSYISARFSCRGEVVKLADFAIVKLYADLAPIPSASVNMQGQAPGTEVVLNGYGSTNPDVRVSDNSRVMKYGFSHLMAGSARPVFQGCPSEFLQRADFHGYTLKGCSFGDLSCVREGDSGSALFLASASNQVIAVTSSFIGVSNGKDEGSWHVSTSSELFRNWFRPLCNTSNIQCL